MDSYYDVYSYTERLKVLVDFFSILAARESSVAVFGWRKLCAEDKFANVLSILDEFESLSYKFLRVSKSINSTLHEDAHRILYDDKLLSQLTIVLTVLKIEVAKVNSSIPGRAHFINLFSMYRFFLTGTASRLFSTFSIPELIASLHRLQQLSSMVGSEFVLQDDNNIFSPSRINRDTVLDYINIAIDSLNDVNISKEQRHIIIQQLTICKQDISEEKTPWKQIIGSLIIISTLLSGLADAPQAYDNVNKAITHIVNSSVIKPYQPMLPSIFTNPTAIQTPELPSGNID